MLTGLYFSILGAEEFQTTIEERWEQSWLIPQHSRSTWSDSKDFNKVFLVSQIIGYKPKRNNKNDDKCMDKYLQMAPK